MNSLIKINQEGLVSARELHEFLGNKRQFTDWIKQRISECDFVENEDFSISQNCEKGGRPSNEYGITVDVAKELSMLEKTEKGRQARKYFIQVEKAWNSPEMIMKRALEIADYQIKKLQLVTEEQQSKIEEDKPKVLFSEAVENSEGLILVKEMATILTQSGFEVGQNGLYEYLRKYNYLCSKKGGMYNLPTKKYEHLFKVTKRNIQRTDGIDVKNTPKLTGKGQLYFVKKFAEYSLRGLTIKNLLKEKVIV